MPFIFTVPWACYIIYYIRMLHFHSRLRANKSIQMIGKKKNLMEFTPPSAKVVFERILRLNRPGIRWNIPSIGLCPAEQLHCVYYWFGRPSNFLLTVFCLSEFMIMENGQVMLYINVRRETKGCLNTFRAFIWESRREDYRKQPKTGNSFAIELPAISPLGY